MAWKFEDVIQLWAACEGGSSSSVQECGCHTLLQYFSPGTLLSCCKGVLLPRALGLPSCSCCCGCRGVCCSLLHPLTLFAVPSTGRAGGTGSNDMCGTQGWEGRARRGDRSAYSVSRGGNSALSDLRKTTCCHPGGVCLGVEGKKDLL